MPRADLVVERVATGQRFFQTVFSEAAGQVREAKPQVHLAVKRQSEDDGRRRRGYRTDISGSSPSPVYKSTS
jgi:hypothetical protein